MNRYSGAFLVFFAAMLSAQAAELSGPGDLVYRLRNHPLAQARLEAAEGIGRMGSDAPGDAVSALLAAAHDQDSGVRRAAVRALQLLGAHGQDVVKAMAGELSDPDWVVRQEAAGAFASFGAVDAATVEAIQAGLASEDWQVRYAAVTALSGLAPDNAVDLKRLTKVLQEDKHWEVSAEAALAIGRSGSRAASEAPALIEAVKYFEPEVAEAAVQALAQIGVAAVPALSEAVRDPFPHMRWNAARALALIGKDAAPAVNGLAAALDDPEERVRWEVAWALRAIGSTTTIPALTKAIGDEAWRIRWAALRAFASIGQDAREAVPLLAAALKDPDSRVCEAAAFALEKMGQAARDVVPAMIEVLVAPSDSCKVIDVGPSVTNVLMENGWTVQWAVARALGVIGGDTKSIQVALSSAIKHENWQVRGMAALSMGRLGDPGAVPVLMNALSDESDGVRMAAAAALGSIGPPAQDALPALEGALADQNEDEVEQVRKAIERISGR